jgi:hypothetical protein
MRRTAIALWRRTEWISAEHSKESGHTIDASRVAVALSWLSLNQDDAVNAVVLQFTRRRGVGSERSLGVNAVNHRDRQASQALDMAMYVSLAAFVCTANLSSVFDQWGWTASGFEVAMQVID